jgi:S1-C subfamily serine protease
VRSIDHETALRLAADKYEDPIAKIIKSTIAASCTVYVKSLTPNGGLEEWTGSGFHLGHGIVVTASHVAPPTNLPLDIELMFEIGKTHSATVMASESGIDAAILLTDDADEVPSVTLGDSELAEVGDIIAVIASPEGWHDTATVGRISNAHQSLGEDAPTPAWNDIIFIDADILQGASGGMVIGTDGLVYGLVMGVAGAHAELGIGERSVCPSNKIKALLSKTLRQSV